MGTAKDDQIWGLAIDKDDNLYVSGYEQGVTGVTNIEPYGDSRAVVMKYSPTAEKFWKTVLDTPGTDTAEDVVVDPASGKVFVVGRTTDAFSGFANQGQFDLFLAILDGDGATRTTFQAGDERPQHPARLGLGLAHEVLVAGFDDTYVVDNYVAAWEDGFVASFQVDPAQNYAVNQSFWQKVPVAASNRITGVAVEQDGSGAMYVSSYVSGSPVTRGIFVKKLNPDGSLIWSKRISPSTGDAVNAVALSPSGELFVTGATFFALGQAQFGQQDAFLLKLDKATGATLWGAQAGSSASDWPTALAFDAIGNVYLSGDTLGSVVSGGMHQGGNDIFAMKFDASGHFLSAWQAGTSGDDQSMSLVVDHCGNVYLGGFTTGNLVPGHLNAGGYDMFVLRASL